MESGVDPCMCTCSDWYPSPQYGETGDLADARDRSIPWRKHHDGVVPHFTQLVKVQLFCARGHHSVLLHPVVGLLLTKLVDRQPYRGRSPNVVYRIHFSGGMARRACSTFSPQVLRITISMLSYCSLYLQACSSQTSSLCD